MKRYLILILICFSNIVFCLGNSYYVNNTIGDNSTGEANNINKPFYSISYVYNNKISNYGDTIYIVNTGKTYIDHITGSKQCSIVGIGINRPKIQADLNYAIYFDNIPENPNDTFQFIFSNLDIFAEPSYDVESVYIVFDLNYFANKKIYIENCKFNGLYISGLNDTAKVYIKNNYFKRIKDVLRSRCLFLQSSYGEYYITNNTFYYDTSVYSTSYGIIYVDVFNPHLLVSNNFFYSDYNINLTCLKLNRGTLTIMEALNNNVYNLTNPTSYFSASTFYKPDVILNENNDTILVGITTKTNEINFASTKESFQGAYGRILYDTNDIIFSGINDTHIYKTFIMDSPKYLRQINIDYSIVNINSRIGSETEPYIKINIDNSGWETYKIGKPLNRLVNNKLDLDIWLKNN